MNLVFKSFNLYILLTIICAMLFAQILGLFLPNNFNTKYIIKEAKATNNNIQISKLFGIVKKELPKNLKVIKSGRSQLKLRAFSISAIFLDGKYSEVIVRDAKGGIFLSVGDIHKGYRVKELFMDKVIFTKNGDEYYAFLSPDDEKAFKESIKKGQRYTALDSNRKDTTGTMAKKMFEDVKFKNGKYYIPKDLLLSYKNLKKIFSSISIQVFRTKGKSKFKVTRVASGSVFSKIGLKRGDFILKVNDEEMKTLTSPLKYFNNLDNIKNLKLTIERRTKLQELQYEIY